ncbi:hypothetical protein [Inquilinus sp.]|jgi:hypothetical protein|uniref:hypothetical protein n=1 Tax=Inquilinus sp. TaxID=1932117 RepID=UPI0037831A2B
MAHDVQTLEALLQEVDDLPPDTSHHDIWVPERLSFRRDDVHPTIAMSLLVDHLLAKNLYPAGFTQGIGGRMYHYRRDSSTLD